MNNWRAASNPVGNGRRKTIFLRCEFIRRSRQLPIAAAVSPTNLMELTPVINVPMQALL